MNQLGWLSFTALTFFTLAVSTPAKASGRIVGNGGHGVVCTVDGVTTYEVLDHYEARVFRGTQPDTGDPFGTLFERAVELIKRWHSVDPARTRDLLSRLKSVSERHVIIDNFDLEPTDDVGDVQLQRGCRLFQLAVYREPDFPGDPVLTISKEMWEKLDDANRVVLFVHEAVYQALLSAGVSNSRSTRYWVNRALANNFSDFAKDLESYLEALQATGFQQFVFSRWNLPIQLSVDQVTFTRDEVTRISRVDFALPLQVRSKNWSGWVCSFSPRSYVSRYEARSQFDFIEFDFHSSPASGLEYEIQFQSKQKEECFENSDRLGAWIKREQYLDRLFATGGSPIHFSKSGPQGVEEKTLRSLKFEGNELPTVGDR